MPRAQSKIESRKFPAAFSLIEMLLVIAIIGIMASIVIAAFANAAADSRRVLVSQQQAVLQEAVNNWITGNSTGFTSATPPTARSLATARTAYNAAATGRARLELVAAYLDDATYHDLHDHTTTAAPNDVLSTHMLKTGQHLVIGDWAAGSYPKVTLVTPAE